MKFVQKRFLKRNEFDIVENGVKVKSKKLGEYSEYLVPFENIGTEIQVHVAGKRSLWVWALVCFLISIWMMSDNFLIGFNKDSVDTSLFFLLVTIFLVIMFYFTRLNSIYLVGSKYIEFIRNNPNEDEIKRFINQIIDKRNSYLRSRYANIDCDLPLDAQLNMIKHLKDTNVISEQEFTELKKILIQGTVSDSSKSIGFN